MRRPWLFGALLLSILLLTLHLLALAHYWYWVYWWFDVMMHLLGGVTLGVFFVALSRTPRPLLYLVLTAVCFVGWEVIEYVGGISRNEPNFTFDTAHDLLDDVLGATAVYALARFSVWRSR